MYLSLSLYIYIYIYTLVTPESFRTGPLIALPICLL